MDPEDNNRYHDRAAEMRVFLDEFVDSEAKSGPVPS